MVALTIVLGIGIGVFLLWFGEALMRDSMEQEDVIVFTRKHSSGSERRLYSREYRSASRHDGARVESSCSKRAA